MALGAKRAVVGPKVEPSFADLTRTTVKDKELDNVRDIAIWDIPAFSFSTMSGLEREK